MSDLPSSASMILKIAVPVPLFKTFDYLLADDLKIESLLPGLRVTVPFGRSTKTGILIEIVEHASSSGRSLKTIEAVLDEAPLLGEADIALLHWACQYYHHPIGEVFIQAFPLELRKGKAAHIKTEKNYVLSEKGLLLSADQLKRAPKQQALFEFLQSQQNATIDQLKQWNSNWRGAMKGLLDKQLVLEQSASASAPAVIRKIRKQAPLPANAQQTAAIEQISTHANEFSVFLLEGVTGSGKTEVYMQVIDQVLQQGLQVLVLLPEITLTPQLEQRFQQRFAVPIVATHSRLTDRQRLNAWLQMQQGRAMIMLGTRSALLTPLAKPGLIVLDEEHDSSFKQQEGFRFSARDVAVMKARQLNIPIVLGSATPSFESLYNAEQGRYQKLLLLERAGGAGKPFFQILDIRNKRIYDGLSEPLVTAMKATLAAKQQVLLFLNRRGFAPVQMCHSCGYVSRCQRCDANLVIHYEAACLRCHHCGSEQKMMVRCPHCKQGELQPLGIGTERIEKSLHQLFPDHKILRLDRDSTQRKGALENYLDQINRGEADIILGTQMLSKGHHFPNVTLVAILDVDSGLFSIDYHSAEKLAQMIEQVAGRAGRAEKRGKVILQTRHPEHPLLTVLINQGYPAFARNALLERKQANLPPYSFQVLIRVQASDTQSPLSFLSLLSDYIHGFPDSGVAALGPVTAPMAKKAGQFRYQLLLQSNQRKSLHNLVNQLTTIIQASKQAKKVRWSIDIDPVDLY